MQNEIYHCGPIACGIDAMPLLNWESGIISTAGSGTAHIISIGWFAAEEKSTGVGELQWLQMQEKRLLSFATGILHWNTLSCSECCMVSFAEPCVILLHTRDVSK